MPRRAPPGAPDDAEECEMAGLLGRSASSENDADADCEDADGAKMHHQKDVHRGGAGDDGKNSSSGGGVTGDVYGDGYAG